MAETFRDLIHDAVRRAPPASPEAGAAYQRRQARAVKREIYVGKTLGERDEIFQSDIEPTRASHGDRYPAVIGPFRTMRGARFYVAHGRSNPHIQTSDDADRIASIHECFACSTAGMLPNGAAR